MGLGELKEKEGKEIPTDHHSTDEEKGKYVVEMRKREERRKICLDV